jgi:transcriptional repressor NrdR
MVCIYCDCDTQVINSRLQKRLNSVWRRRRCTGCQAITTTTERTDLASAVVVGRKGQLEPFLRDKLYLSLYEVLKHRKTAISSATALTDTVISQISLRSRIESEHIASVAYKVLRRYDKASAIYYQAQHLSRSQN